MPFQKYKFLVLPFLLSSSIFASELSSLEESIVSNERLKLIDLGKKQVIEDSDKLKKDWINAVSYTYSKVYGEEGKSSDIEKSYISIDQPIFKSGGIYQAIKYANATKKYSNLELNLQKKALITDTTSLLFQIHKLKYQIEKQKLLVKNGEIDIQRKKEQVLNGFADASVLDNAILDTNSAKNALAELEYQKEELINSFSNYARGDWKNFKLPNLKLISEKKFINSNLSISKTNADIEAKDNYASMTISKYLPTVSATYNYTKYHETNSAAITYDSVYNYGFKVYIPLDVRTFNDIESSRIDYLKAKLNLEVVEKEQKNLFKTKVAKVKMLEKKMEIAKSDYELYDSLLQIIIEEKNAGLKTQSDVDTLMNSKRIKEFDLSIHKLDKQIELLKLYAQIQD